MNAKEVYERLFVAFYGWSLRVDGKKGGYTVLYASMMLSLALILNIAGVAMIADMVSPRPFLVYLTHVSKIWLIFGIVAFMSVHLLYFLHDDRYRRAIAKYGPTEDQIAKRSPGKLIVYMIISLVSVVGLMISR